MDPAGPGHATQLFLSIAVTIPKNPGVEGSWIYAGDYLRQSELIHYFH